MTESFWERGDWSRLTAAGNGTAAIAQGDFLSGCLVPVVDDDFGPDNPAARAAELNLIVVTQTCDLVNDKARLGERDRLLSPYLEHFSQAFARFFMRVGLPGPIPAFK